jgi:hypothetical protein
MTADELREHNATIPKAKKATAVNALPQPSSDQVESFYRMNQATSSGKEVSLLKLFELATANKK